MRVDAETFVSCCRKSRHAYGRTYVHVYSRRLTTDRETDRHFLLTSTSLPFHPGDGCHGGLLQHPPRCPGHGAWPRLSGACQIFNPSRLLTQVGWEAGETLFPPVRLQIPTWWDRARDPSRWACCWCCRSSSPRRDVFIHGGEEKEGPFSSPDDAGSMPSSRIAPHRICLR